VFAPYQNKELPVLAAARSEKMQDYLKRTIFLSSALQRALVAKSLASRCIRRIYKRHPKTILGILLFFALFEKINSNRNADG